MTWPRKIFLESTALFQLGPRLENVELANLQEVRNILKFELFVSEVSWREYLRHRSKEIRGCLARIRSCSEELAQHGQPVAGLEQAEQRATEYLNVLADHFQEKARNSGITILPLPPIDLQKLLQMSIGCVPPFEDSESERGEKTKEKGFRDSLIMFTVLEGIRNRPQDNALIITGDRRLREGFQRLVGEYETRLDIVASLDEALSHIDDKVEKWQREKRRRQSEEAKDMLLRYRQEISEAIRQVRDLTEADLGQGLFSRVLAGKEGQERLDIREVVSLGFESVESALWKDRDKPISRILFRIRCVAHVVASPPAPFVFWDTPVFTVGGGRKSNIRLSASEGVVERDLPVALSGEASFEQTDGEWRLMNIKVDQSLPPEEDWKELMKAKLEK
jgi:hypothetical protein